MDATSPHAKHVGRAKLKTWLDGLDERLVAEGKQAGIFEHSTMIGDAREFIVERLLKTFLPPALFIGSGKVIGALGISSQCDVVISDPSFPVIRDAGQCYFPIEGVIAVVEVKSKLDRGKLRETLDNLWTIQRLGFSSVKADMNAIMGTLQPLGIDTQLSNQTIANALLPASYVLGFRGLKDRTTLMKHVTDWFMEKSPAPKVYPTLPNLIVSEATVGMQMSDIDVVGTTKAIDAAGRAIDPSKAQHIMGFWESTRMFGLLATNILNKIQKRAMLQSGGLLRGAFHDYLPFREYFQDHFDGKNWCALTVHGPDAVLQEAPQ